MPPKKTTNITPPTVIIRRKAGKPTSRSIQTTQPATPAAPPLAPPVASSPKRPRVQSNHTQTKPSLIQSTTQPAQPSAQSAPALPTSASVQVHSQPETTSQASPRLNRRQRDAQAQRALLATLRERWPHVFPQHTQEVRPLAVGIHKTIAVALPNTPIPLIKRTIALFQRLNGGAYWQAVLKGGARYDLDGNTCGVVTATQQEQAKQELAKLSARLQAKRQQRAVAL